MARRHYSDADRAEALAALDANAGNVALTSHEIGIPTSTIDRWVKNRDRAAPPELRDEKKADLSDLFRRELEAVFEAMKIKRGDASYADLSRGAGIYADKLMALTDSMPTQRVESKDTTETERRAARILTMMDQVDKPKKAASA